MGTNFWDAILSPFAVQLGKGIMLAVWTATFVHIVRGAK
jgi:hypothetical protein